MRGWVFGGCSSRGPVAVYFGRCNCRYDTSWWCPSRIDSLQAPSHELGRPGGSRRSWKVMIMNIVVVVNFHCGRGQLKIANFGLAIIQRRWFWGRFDEAPIVAVITRIFEWLIFATCGTGSGNWSWWCNCWWRCYRRRRSSLSRKGCSWRRRRLESVCPYRPNSSWGSIRARKSSSNGFDVFLPDLVIEILDAPFCTYKVNFCSTIDRYLE